MEGFGDPRLVNRELLPAADDARWLRRWHIVGLWGGVACAPGVFAFVSGQGRSSVGGALAALAVGTAAVAVIGWVLSRPAVRYGVSFAILCRAAFGARGAWLPLALRWIVGVAWLAGWALAVAVWSRRLLVVALAAWGVTSRALNAALTWHLPHDGVAVASWMICVLLLVVAWWIARGGLRAVAVAAAIGVPLAVAGGAALAIYGGIRSAGFGAWIERPGDGSRIDGAVAALAAVSFLLPAVISCGDWMRSRPRKGARWGVAAAPWVMVPVVAALAFFAALIASAAFAVLGKLEGSPIADATGYGGLWAGAGAVLMTVAAWVAAAPLVGFFSPGLALAALLPRRWRFRGGALATALAATLAVPLFAYGGAHGLSFALLVDSLFAVLGVLLADQLIVRRGRMVLEEVYVYRSDHGPLVGFKVSALVAVAVGWCFLPPVWLVVAPRIGMDSWLAAEGSAGYGALLVPGSAVIAAALYALLAPLEIGLAHGVSRVVVGVKALDVKASIRKRRSEALPARWVSRGSQLEQEKTNPYFEYDGDDPPEPPVPRAAGDTDPTTADPRAPRGDPDTEPNASDDEEGSAGGEIPEGW